MVARRIAVKFGSWKNTPADQTYSLGLIRRNRGEKVFPRYFNIFLKEPSLQEHYTFDWFANIPFHF